MRAFVVCLTVLPVAAACLLSGARPASAFSPVTQFDRTTGLVENTVQVITRDPEGKLWIGTRGGLSRFDGEQWINLTDEDGLPGNDINAIFIEAAERIWLGTKNGFGLMRDGSWSRLGLPGAGDEERVSVVADAAGGIWFGYSGGLMRYGGESEGLAVIAALEGVAVTALLPAGEEGLWVGTKEGLRYTGDIEGESFEEIGEFPSSAVTALLEDSRGTIWVGTDDGVVEHDGLAWTVHSAEEGLPNTSVTALAEDREGRVWVGTRGGAGWYDGYDWIWVGRRQGLPSDNVLALCADRNGSIWVGTEHGLTKYDTSWSHPRFLGSDEKAPSAPLLRSRSGTIFIGTDEGLLEKEGRSVDWIGPREMTGRAAVLLEDREGMVWAGTDQGLYLLDRGVEEHFLPPEHVTEYVTREQGITVAVQKRYYDRHQGLKDEKVTALWEDPEGGLWVGTAAGLSWYDGDGEWDPLDEAGEVGGGEVTALSGTGDELWVGTSSGLWVRRDGSWSEDTALREPVLALLRDRSGSLWAGTARGLFRRDGPAWSRVESGPGTLGEQILTIFQDRRGDLWFGTEAGVARFDGAHWSAWSETDGLHANRIVSIAEVGEELWFASSGGVSIYRPDRAPPDTRIKNVPRDTVGASSYLFEFTGSDFETAPPRLLYSWKLDDGDWAPFTAAPRVTVADLANGTHRFTVRSMDRGLNIDPLPATVTFQVDTGLFDLELVQARFRELYASLYQYYASDTDYARNPVATVKVKNKFDRPLRVKMSLFIPSLMDFPTDHVVPVPAREVLEVPLRVELSEQVLSLEGSVTRQALLTMQYSLRGELKESTSTHPVTILEKNSMTWKDPLRIGLYVSHLDGSIESFARGVVSQFREVEKDAIIYDNLLRAIVLYDALGALGVRYIADPQNPYGGFTLARPELDLIRFPRETLRAKSGDCDDVSVLYAALLENLGIDTALVDVYDHVFVMFDTGLKRRQSGQLTTDPDLLYVDDEEKVWIPVEVTLLGGTFTEAWKVGAKMLRERRYEILTVENAWKKYAPLLLREPSSPPAVPTREEIWPLFREDLHLQEETLISSRVREFRRRLKADPQDVGALNSLGVLLAKNGYLRQAAERFRRVIELAPAFPGGYSNLANVLYEQEDYKEAVKYYRDALELEPASPEVHVELALTYCELGQFDTARLHYETAMKQTAAFAPGGGQ